MSEPKELPSSSILIDTHCHLDDDAFADDLDAVLAESLDAGVRGWINVGFETERWQSSIELASRTPGMSVMLGIHPASAGQWTEATRDALRARLAESGAVAIGEIGLDFLRPEPSPDIQMRALSEQLDLAIACDLPVVIHMREAEAAMLEVLQHRSALPPLLFHSYDGGPDLTRFVLESGSRVGVGGLLTRQKSERLREQIRRIPLARIVLETDSPYLIPARQRARRNTPAHVRTVATFLAGVKSTDDETVSSETTANAFRFFGKLRTA